ncbi:MAG: YtxH domain-containing protein [Candidatus Pacebacteria bacterium]|nr:YtxH domain-containing protein [Candidatus Paceibacterota bacterium]
MAQEKKVQKQGEANGSVAKGIALGAGLVAMAAAGYMLFGPEGKSNRKKIKGWTLKAKGEILEALEKMSDVTQDKYESVVEKVSKKYAKVKDVTEDEIKKFEKEARKHWKDIASDLAGAAPKKKAKKAK